MTNELEPMGIQSKETVDLAAAKAQDAASWSRTSVDQALDKAKDKVDDAKAGATNAIDNAAGATSALADKAKDPFQSVKGQVRAQAANVSDKVADYTQEDPLKAMLIAAAAGALLMGLLTLMVRARD